MKGIVFNLLQEVVSREYGEDTWDSLLESASLDGAYTAVGSYPDEDLTAIVNAASAALGLSGDEIVRWYGRKALPLLYDKYPQFFDVHESSIPFVLTLNEVIHPEVRKLFPGAYVPEFEFGAEKTSEGELVLSYVSRRRLCSFAEGLLEGAADHFGETVDVVHTECMKRGDEKCVLVCTFASTSEEQSATAG
jgi:hypothetical protein